MPPRLMVLGASGGLGSACAQSLAAAGAELVLVARRPGPLRALAEPLGARAIPWDLGRDAALLVDIAGEVDGLVWCVAPGAEAPGLEGARRVLALCCWGPLALIEALGPRAPRALAFGPSAQAGPAWRAAHAALERLAPPQLRLADRAGELAGPLAWVQGSECL